MIVSFPSSQIKKLILVFYFYFIEKNDNCIYKLGIKIHKPQGLVQIPTKG